MSAIELQAFPHQTHNGLPYTHIHIRIVTESGVIVPADLNGITLPKGIDSSLGIVIEGKAPIWLYGYLIWGCTPAAWTGCYDPRLGIIVLASHIPDVSAGNVLSVDLPKWE